MRSQQMLPQIASSISHVAIIMDGNGRWATKKMRPRVAGHIRGSQIIEPIINSSVSLGINSLTLYAFSTENWSRPKMEVMALLKLLKKYLQREFRKIIANNLKFKVIGSLDFPDDFGVFSLIRDLETATQNNTGMKLQFAFNYGSRNELVKVINNITSAKKNEQDFVFNSSIISEFLDRESLSEVDLIIRTGGDLRLSNFLLWQAAYAELFFSKTLWPDFKPEEFENIIKEVRSRSRKFGGVP